MTADVEVDVSDDLRVVARQLSTLADDLDRAALSSLGPRARQLAGDVLELSGATSARTQRLLDVELVTAVHRALHELAGRGYHVRATTGPRSVTVQVTTDDGLVHPLSVTDDRPAT